MTAALVIGFSGTQGSGAVPSEPAALTAAPENCPAGSVPATNGCIDVKPVFIERCPSARKAVKFYAGRVAYWRNRMGTLTERASRHPSGRCPRYLAHVFQRKAYGLRKAYVNWHFYHYRWDHWLPAKWYRIARCETGVNWQHSNSSYEGAFGFAKQSWDSFKYRADPKAGPYPEDAWQATPRQQYEVALAIYRAYGFSGWGCRAA